MSVKMSQSEENAWYRCNSCGAEGSVEEFISPENPNDKRCPECLSLDVEPDNG
jgi:DNA-directed RNA polymerase subunit RPC12/RpoP